MKLALLAVVIALPLAAQTAGKVEVFSASNIKTQLTSMAPKAMATGGSTATVGEYPSHLIMFSQRTANGGGEVHQHRTDIMIVQQGTATLVTGGTLIDPHTESEGELRGTGIKDGQSQTITVGDIVQVPAGTPHQLQVAAGMTYSAVVIKVKE
ncbi:MAG TPA: hypothetical protein VH088_02120 [Terriglobales bacterium]|jgi:mannose-6-phosphate isomerase-like protein (cupin superfamily)|nr:hypothetical protein [Terriglobales bacterium]